MENPPDPISSPQAQGQSTTFVHTDANSFKALVQRLTGPKDESSAQTSPSAPSAPARSPGVRRPTTFKLQERRQGSRSKLAIMKPNSPLIPLMGSSSSPSGLVSPSSPSAYLSGLKLSNGKTPKVSNLDLDEAAEEKAIKERRFYLHPSPRGFKPMSSDPELLPLFPLSSPNPKPVGP